MKLRILSKSRAGALALAMAAGCGGSDGDDANPAVDAAETTADAAISAGVLPVPGAWHYSQYTPTQDSCGGGVDGDGDFSVELIADGFRIVRVSNPASTCTVDANANFQCTTPPETRDHHPTTDAFQTATLSLSGRLTTPTLAPGVQGIVITCVGSECNTLDTPACSVTANVVLVKW